MISESLQVTCLTGEALTAGPRGLRLVQMPAPGLLFPWSLPTAESAHFPWTRSLPVQVMCVL